MCGILGFYSEDGLLDKKKRKGINKAFAALDIRGKHASGIAGAINNHMSMYKLDVPSSFLVTHKGYRDIVSSNQAGILHARYTTRGSETLNENNHPFMETMFDNSVVTMVHNGVISNYDDLAKRFKLESTIQTDSLIILHLVNKFYKKYNNMEKAITHAVRWLNGTFALMFLHVTRESAPVLYFLKHSNPITVIDYNGCKVLCSTPEILKKGFTFTKEFKIDENVLYKINGSKEVWICNDLKIYKPVTPKYKYSYPINNYPAYNPRASYWDDNGYEWSQKTTKCTDCGEFKKDVVWSIPYTTYLCSDCHEKRTVIKPDNNFGVCDACNDHKETTLYRSSLNGYICDECLLEALAEGKETNAEKEYCLE